MLRLLFGVCWLHSHTAFGERGSKKQCDALKSFTSSSSSRLTRKKRFPVSTSSELPVGYFRKWGNLTWQWPAEWTNSLYIYDAKTKKPSETGQAVSAGSFGVVHLVKTKGAKWTTGGGTLGAIKSQRPSSPSEFKHAVAELVFMQMMSEAKGHEYFVQQWDWKIDRGDENWVFSLMEGAPVNIEGIVGKHINKFKRIGAGSNIEMVGAGVAMKTSEDIVGSELHIGRSTKIRGLTQNQDLNGKDCILQAYNVAKERWTVQVNGHTSKGWNPELAVPAKRLECFQTRPGEALPIDWQGNRERAFLFVDLLRGMEAMHKKGIVHRDIKGANVLVTAGRAKYADFGLSCHPAIYPCSSIGGTPKYWAPEIWEALEVVGGKYHMTNKLPRGVVTKNNQTKERLGIWNDVWALGVVFYELAFLETPKPLDFVMTKTIGSHDGKHSWSATEPTGSDLPVLKSQVGDKAKFTEWLNDDIERRRERLKELSAANIGKMDHLTGHDKKSFLDSITTAFKWEALIIKRMLAADVFERASVENLEEWRQLIQLAESWAIFQGCKPEDVRTHPKTQKAPDDLQKCAHSTEELALFQNPTTLVMPTDKMVEPGALRQKPNEATLLPSSKRSSGEKSTSPGAVHHRSGSSKFTGDMISSMVSDGSAMMDDSPPTGGRASDLLKELERLAERPEFVESLDLKKTSKKRSIAADSTVASASLSDQLIIPELSPALHLHTGESSDLQRGAMRSVARASSPSVLMQPAVSKSQGSARIASKSKASMEIPPASSPPIVQSSSSEQGANSTEFPYRPLFD